ncbi:DUF2264 domain-containing protein [Desulfonatronum thiosulfatophilum]|uniref:DUF2264 domain-containing protein n=1 Tax=Desulfonatronum thiosulfatophilum TaxID=617002 RepID=UPI003CC5B94D
MLDWPARLPNSRAQRSLSNCRVCPLVAGAESYSETVTPGEARRALDVTWQYFLARRALRKGIVTQGYHGPDPRILDLYAGPASSLWSLRSLVMAFYYPPNHLFWSVPTQPLPVEQNDFELYIAGPEWKVTGERSTGAITIEVLGNPIGAPPSSHSTAWTCCKISPLASHHVLKV